MNEELQHQAIVDNGAKLGISAGSIITLISVLGPKVVEVILELLHRKQPQGPDPKLGLSLSGLSSLIDVRSLIVGLIKAHKDEVISFLTEEESKVLDLIVTKLGG